MKTLPELQRSVTKANTVAGAAYIHYCRVQQCPTGERLKNAVYLQWMVLERLFMKAVDAYLKIAPPGQIPRMDHL